MRPRKLRIKGLNSFVEEQSIDFQRLTERGLFGIFGPTGSGKSTILDAMTIVLYGEISRNTKEFVNAESDQLSLSYEFAIGSSQGPKIYVVERTFKKGEDGLRKAKDARLYEHTDPQRPEVIAEGIKEVTKAIQQLIGLTAEDFTRSVVLPQGKFSEFLGLGGIERRNMLERIFRLEKYGRDFTDRIRRLRNEKDSALKIVLSKLEVYGGLTAETYEKEKEEFDILSEKVIQMKEEFTKIQAQYEQYQRIWELQEEWEGLRKKKENLDREKTLFAEKKRKLDQSRKAEVVIPIIQNLEQTIHKLTANEKTMKTLEMSTEKMKQELEVIQTQYEAAAHQKDHQYPLLVEKEAKLKQGLEIQERIEAVERERRQLLGTYKQYQGELLKLEQEKKRIAEQQQGDREQLQRLESRKQEIHIEPGYRQAVEAGYQLERAYIEQSRQKQELTQKLQSLSEQMQALQEAYEEVKGRQEQVQGSLQKSTEALTVLGDKAPTDPDALLRMQEEISDLKNQYMQVAELTQKKAAYQERHREIQTRRQELLGQMEVLQKKIEDVKVRQIQIEEEIHMFQRNSMAGLLAEVLQEGEPCPVCGSAHHPHPAPPIIESLRQKLVDQQETMGQKLTGMTEQLHSLSIEHARVQQEEERLVQTLEEIHLALGGRLPEALNQQLQDRSRQFAEQKIGLQQWEQDKKELQQTVDGLKDMASRLSAEEARVSESLHKDEIKKQELLAEENIGNQKLRETIQEYEGNKSQLQIQSFGAKIEEIRRMDQELIDVERQLKKLQEKIQENEKSLEGTSGQVQDMLIRLGKIEESGKEKRGFIDQQKKIIEVLTEGRVLQEYLEEVLENMGQLLEREKYLKIQLDTCREQKQKVQEDQIRAEKQEETLKDLQTEQEEKLKAGLEKTGFPNPEAVQSAYLSPNNQEVLEKEVLGYEEECRSIENHMERIRNKLGQEHITSEQWAEIRQQKEEKQKEQEGVGQALAVLRERLLNMDRDLMNIQKLTQQKQQLEHTYSLLEDLSKLVQGNKFVEFVAVRQLTYIAREASKRLKQITRGRYGLELDKEGNFIIRDDFNGGQRRSPNTLSGGETFLTSLSLALSLSSQIQLKNSAPLELFFLDEGFGTLDSGLLDTVMSSLETLHSEKMSVGIISHVEELKARIPVKLLVTPAQQGIHGSKVDIEYS